MKLITGMHRSGTSITARIFFEAGADLGDPQTFYPADRWNPDGYFEQLDMHAINMPLINGPWGKLANIHLPSTRTIMRRAEAMASQIEATAARYQGKVVKEVRIALNMPAWLKYGTEFEHILVCLREPYAAAKSIQQRFHIPVWHGYYIWKEYFSRLLDHMGDRPAWYIRYSYVMNPATFSDEMGSALRHMGYNLNEAQLDALRSRCIRPELEHYRQIPGRYPPAIEDLWSELKRRHAAQRGGEAQITEPSNTAVPTATLNPIDASSP